MNLHKTQGNIVPCVFYDFFLLFSWLNEVTLHSLNMQILMFQNSTQKYKNQYNLYIYI